MIHLILLSGGSGKRLWPLSNDARSKQFLRILNNNNEIESMVQRVWRQLNKAGLSKSAVIATGQAHYEILKRQLGTDVSVVIEPERRDTFPAIALASSFLRSQKNADLQDTLIILPVDPYVEDGFFESLSMLENILNDSGSKLALIGVKPTYPSEKYGYILPAHGNEDNNEFKRVKSFKEKPSKAEAEKLLDLNALWNCGVFAFKLEYIFEILNNKGICSEYYNLLENYTKLPKISFDYEVVEKTSDISVYQYNGYWKDLGTWNTLTDEMGSFILGDGILSEDASNTHIINELEVPIAVLGVSNVVVAASPDGILVCDKSESAKVKEFVEPLIGKPKYEERLWGSYRSLEYKKYDEEHETLIRRVSVIAGHNISYHKHTNRQEVWTIVRGSGIFILDGDLCKVDVGSVLNIPANTKHSIKAITDLEFIEVQQGSNLFEEDIERYSTDWSTIIEDAVRI